MIVNLILVLIVVTYIIGLVTSPVMYWHFQDYNKEQRLNGSHRRVKKWHILVLILAAPIVIPLMAIMMLADLALYVWGFLKSLSEEIS